ncbi:unnamed protein product [Paramecium pentaurelia]|uniref:Uncharacterized protein n=1 Tax=Paramecium pentaurelia TaxID=43138 RepID=A0A8S1VE52_9CILI|nr:unnamed protein product [Paramecium pentaurelia]
MKFDIQNFLEKCSRILILLANITQSSWWMYLEISSGESLNYILLPLLLANLITRVFQYILMENKHSINSVLPILSLTYYVLYFELLFLQDNDNQLLIYSNSLIFTISYFDYLKIDVQRNSFICKIGLPFYLSIKIILYNISQSSYKAIESLILIILIVIHQIITHYCQFNLNTNNKTNEKQVTRKLDNLNSPISENYLMQSQIKYQKSNSVVQTPKQCFTTILKDLPNEEKLKQYSIITSFSKSQIFYKSLGSSDHSAFQLYNNLINLFPYGILIVNQQQQVSQLNNKCEKILECKGTQQVLEKIKMCVNSARMQDYEIEQSNIQQKKQLHYRTLQLIVRKLNERDFPIDILDIIMQPSKYTPIIDQIDQQQIIETFHQQIFIYEWLMNSEMMHNCSQKKLKLIIIPTSNNNIQQDYISAASQVKSLSKSNFTFSDDQDNSVLLIMIKNVTNKYKCQQIRDEQIIHHSLIKSFSHELRTPLNSCQQMLNLMKSQDLTSNLQECIDIAQCSLALLIHQINDILDYAAIQSQQFSYHINNFVLKEIIEEIEHLYNLQMKQKKIEFNIKVAQNLIGKIVQNDKQRIIQLLVNVLNNAIKFTQERGCITLKITNSDIFFLNFKVKDNGIGIDHSKLCIIQNCIKDTVKFGSVLKSQQEKQQQGLGLNIAAKLVQGLVESQDNQIIISSRKNQGTVVQFKVQNYIQNTLSQSHFFTLQSSKSNQSISQSQYQEAQFEDSKIIKSYTSRVELDREYQDQQSKSESYNNTSRINDYDKQPDILVPASQYFSEKLLDSNKSLQKLEDSIFSNRQYSICQKCKHVLIVDDVPFNQIALKMILQKYQIDADQAFDGFQAIEMVKQKKQLHCSIYKLIFMDIEMPGIDGFQTSKQILELMPKQPMIVICSAYDSQDNYLESQKLGINTFLQKPVKQQDLEVLLKKAFQNETD